MVQPNTHINGIINLNPVEFLEAMPGLHLQDPPSSFNSLLSSGVPEPEDVYGDTTATAANTATGDNNIDGLLTTHRWQSTTVTYSFTSNFANDYEDELGYSNSAVHAASFETLNATQRAVAREVMEEMYEAVSGLNMVELTGLSDRDATIRVAESDHPSGAYAYNPGNYYEAGDVWFNKTSYNNPVIGNYAYYTFMHEFGHALGLKHGHETGGVADVAMNSNRDSMEFSVMTYRSYEGAPTGGVSNEPWGYAQSLMMYDIAAIQEMYGANFNTNSSNTTYTFSTTTGEMFVNGVGQGTPGDNRVFRTIWDGNGTDTYDFSNYTTNLAIDLAPGGWSDLDVGGIDQRAQLGTDEYARGHVFNALQYNGDTRSLIENANGGSGNDSIEGNSANNVLLGNGGDDSLNGYGGTIGEYDTLSGDYSFSQPSVENTSDGADTFILGDAFGAYYLGFGYATITDFYWYEGDEFQVHGSEGDYSLGFQNWSGDSSNDTLIYYQSDLIAVVEDTTSVIASLDFTFV